MGKCLGTPVKPRPAVFSSDETVLACVDSACTAPAEGMAGISLICNKGKAHRVLFHANVSTKAGKLAGLIGRLIYGTSLACRVVRLVRGDFRCMNRCNGTLQMTTRRGVLSTNR